MTCRAGAFFITDSRARNCATLWLFAALVACSSHHGGIQAAGAAASNAFGNAASGGRGAKNTSAQAGSRSAANSASSGYGACTELGATRSCCGTGTQTCMGAVEFESWGPCSDRNGVVLTCDGTCAQDEFGHCDAGTPFDSGTHCGAGEFGPNCDGGGPPPPSLCNDKSVNTEPEILAAYSPVSGQSVAQDGEIKVWITDEGPAIIAPNEQVDPSTGMITMAGDRTAKANDGYLWEPALYIAPATAESGGRPYFPRFILGAYNNALQLNGGKPVKGMGMTAGLSGPAIESPPAGTRLTDRFNTEDVWEVSDLGLAPGTYEGEFVIHDGDTDRGIGCVTITITP